MVYRLSNIIPLLAAGLLWGQTGNIISSELEFLPDLTDEAVEALNSLLDNPLPINDVTAGELWFLPDSLVDLLIEKRNQSKYTSWTDFQQRASLSAETVLFLQELLIFPADNVQGSLSSRIASSSPDERIRSKLVLEGKRWYAQGILQRDPADDSFANLAAATFSYRHNQTHLALGSHRLHWGNGLVMSGDSWGRTGKSLLSGSATKYYVRPAYSAQRVNILNGVAISKSWSRLTVGSGLSDQNVNLIADQAGNVRPGRSPYNPSGVVGREIIGYALATFQTGKTQLGYLISQRRLTIGDDGSTSHLYQSVTAQYKVAIPLSEVRFGSEVALGNQSLAGVLSLAAIIRPEQGGRLKLLAQLRHYPDSWHSLKGVLPGYGTGQGNGNGWYLGWSWLKTGMELAGYIDSYTALVADHVSGWSPTGVSSGLEIGLPLAVGVLNLRYNQVDTRSGVVVDQLDSPVSYQEQYKVLRQVRSKLRFPVAKATQIDLFAAYRWTAIATNLSRGTVWGSSVQHTQPKGDRMGLGCVVYSTDDWDSRIVAYQFGLPGEMNMRNLYGQGIEIYGRYWIKLDYGQIGLRLNKRLFNSDQSQSKRLWSRGGLQLDINL